MGIWSGRFSKELDSIASEYNSSIGVDHVMFREDIEGSKAHAKMLSECDIISKEDEELIINGLDGIKSDIENKTLEIDMKAEDIHMFIETELTKRIGDAGKRLHTARSRNDQVVTDLRLYLRNLITEIESEIVMLCESIIAKSEQNIDSIMPGYTHLQAAQPVTFAHHLMAYCQMLIRDLSRFRDAKTRLNESPLGAGALATTVYNIDRHRTSELLGFNKPMLNSMDAVSDRDFVIETEYCASMTMMHLSRLSEELIIWSSQEFGYIELDDAFTTGSSIMPQKKNPDMAELTRGKTGTVIGITMGMITTMKGLPLAYNKDLQEDKKGVFEVIDILSKTLKVTRGMIDTLKVNSDTMKAKANNGYIVATDLADYLTEKGMPFRDAYKIVGGIIKKASEEKKNLEDYGIEMYREFSEVFDTDLFEAISLEKSLSRRAVYGGPSPVAVKKQIEETKKILSKTKES
ncbi:argininosuccinate lyase [Microaceticoccus formicicus]|uniref:argininosuccinate lyase n=1 Tax=Microaceticoccus formicicus TaxID=3118105 RepID=UPI003CD002AC|nr:argininosuccinate lyase [Peptoniphilaceae bacterium AMB_02]